MNKLSSSNFNRMFVLSYPVIYNENSKVSTKIFERLTNVLLILLAYLFLNVHRVSFP